MEKFNKEVYNAKFETNEKGELKQNVRNTLKADLMKAFSEFLIENGVENLQTKEGLVIELANEILGAIPAVLNFTMKSLDYDVSGAHDEFVQYQAEKLAKAEKKRLETEKRMKEKEKTATK